MTFRYQRARNVLWLADELRERHPVLNLPVRRQALRYVLEQEGIIVTRAAIRNRAYVDGGDGTFVITVRNDLDGMRLTKVLLHEYAHIHLHMTERGEVTRQLFPCRPGDVREAEADLLAAVLWYGEDATPDYPPIARLMAAVDAPRLKRATDREPDQLQLGMPGGVVMYQHPAYPAGPAHGSFNVLGGESPRPKNRFKGPKIRVGEPHDRLLFDWTKGGRPLGFFHLQLGWIDVWDTMSDPSGREGKREILVCGDRRAQWRDFIISTTDRRRYEFDEGEKRDRSPKALNHQIDVATRVIVSSPIAAASLFRAMRKDV
jgi:hypothetical protein